MDQSSSKDEKLSETQQLLNNFFTRQMDEVKQIKVIEPGNQLLPLARIKKIMKLDEDVKMISAEAPLLFAKATEIFIHELTLRAWLHTEDNKRRTLQRNDIAMAISKYDQFDFLIDIVPRDEIKPKKEAETAKSPPQQEVFYVAQPAQTIQTVSVPTTPQQTIQIQNGIQTATAAPQQNIIIQSPQAQQPAANLIQLGNGGQQIQLVQQVMSANGEIQQIPIQIPQSQLTQMLRQQMGGQPMIAVQAPQAIFQTQPGQNIAIPIQNLQNLGQNIYLTQPTALQQATAAQQQQNSVKEEPH